MTADVHIRGVSHRFGTFTALDTVDLAIPAGQFAVLLGPSGCGKTTLLSILGGFLRPSEGAVLIGGKDVTNIAPAKRPSTTMFQDYALFPHMTLGDNVGFGLRMRGMAKRLRNEKAGEMLDLVGLADAFHKKPHELSGGQRQRVALARALTVDPDLLLLDEPLGALDLKLRRQMQDELKMIQKRVGTTFVHVTHDQEEAMAIADVIVVMNAGKIQDSGPPDAIYLHPRNRFTAAFMGEANFLEATVSELSGSTVTVETGFENYQLPLSAAVGEWIAKGDRIDLCFRPEHVKAHDEKSGDLTLGSAVVSDSAFFGTHHRCHVVSQGAGSTPFTVHLPQSRPVKVGQTIDMSLNSNDVILLPRQEGT